MVRGLGRGRAPSPEFFKIFCLGMLHFGCNLMHYQTPQGLYQIAYNHSLQRAQISLSLPVPHWVRDAGHFRGFFIGGEKRLKGQDVRVTGGIAFGRDSDQR